MTLHVGWLILAVFAAYKYESVICSQTLHRVDVGEQNKQLSYVLKHSSEAIAIFDKKSHQLIFANNQATKVLTQALEKKCMSDCSQFHCISKAEGFDVQDSDDDKDHDIFNSKKSNNDRESMRVVDLRAQSPKNPN